jgi:hypothetical protein
MQENSGSLDLTGMGCPEAHARDSWDSALPIFAMRTPPPCHLLTICDNVLYIKMILESLWNFVKEFLHVPRSPLLEREGALRPQISLDKGGAIS